MADPISLGTLAIAGSAAGGGISAIGKLFEGQSKSDMYTYQAGVAQINKQIADSNADYARWSGDVEAQQSGMATRFKTGQIRTTQSGSGLDINFGNAPRVRESEIDIGQENQAVIRSNAAKRAYGYQVEGVSHEAQANLDRMAASTSKTAGTIGAISSIIGGATSVAGKWYQGGSVFGSGGGSGTDPSFQGVGSSPY